MKLLKNRTVLGVLCIAVSLLICFAVTPLVNAGLSQKTTIVRFVKDVKAGEEIKKGMLLEVEVGGYNLPENVLRSITDSSFLTFGVKGLLQASKNVKDAMLFNVLSYMSNELLTNGRTAACIDEFYLFLTNLTAVEYIRNFMKRVRKKDSAVILASQNLEDFNIDGIREYTKPLFSIPTHVFLFNAGNIDSKFYIDTLQLEQSEYNLIRYPQRGVCLYKCGNERYNLMVHAPEYKEKLFGSAGGR